MVHDTQLSFLSQLKKGIISLAYYFNIAMGKLVKKPHAVCVPYPAQSHISAMLKFAKLLHHKGFHITFVHTEYNYKRTLKSRGPYSLDGAKDFRFEAIPDGLPPPENEDATQDVFQLCLSIAETCYDPFLKLLKNLNNKALTDDESPPVTCIISDCVMPFTLEASEELGIPNAQIWTVNAISAMCMVHYPHLKERGYTPLKDQSYFTNGYLDQTIDWIPGIKSIRLRDIPTVIWTTDPEDIFLDYLMDLMPRTLKGSALIINTFDALEYNVLKQYSHMVDHLYTVGPIHLLLKEIEKEDDDINTIASIQSNMWKEDDSCIEWLDSKEKRSVIYVNFGSITVMTKDQLLEFAWGLANSNQNFLWIIRPDLVADDTMLPPEFMEVTKERGMLSTWCNQEMVLNHPSVSAFLTHCGWNSILESLSAGVPLICWPVFADQQTNCFYCCSSLGVGVEIGNNVDRVEVEQIVRELMEGDERSELRKRTLEWKDKAKEAIRPCVGSSYLNLDKLIEEVLLKPKSKSFA
ncbi:OLC1v1009312C1 [Oldenlandia corymbosa var. corymbosa]|uniref:Glycosyltransferase n=1 Tax=Oldenlandia corymbosa var. corymbosa TaxID=529605 RepID=A0AAV1DQ64_OLDCO|nr:OLC1v1009312C1 [Oldenlandia corymbosa var. corymbosa]